MKYQLDQLNTGQLKSGYSFDKDAGYCCLACGAWFAPGEIYPLKGKFYTAEKAAGMHMQEEHPDYFEALLDHDSKYNTLTDNQKQLLSLFHRGMGDKEIAAALSLSPSTVRHQKFMFREKARQAKLYLALYELALCGEQSDGAKPSKTKAASFVVDKSPSDLLEPFFHSLTPPRLKLFPTKEQKKIAVLAKIAQQFTSGEYYSEAQVNDILSDIYAVDHIMLRRYLIEYKFLARTSDGSSYWRV